MTSLLTDEMESEGDDDDRSEVFLTDIPCSSVVDELESLSKSGSQMLMIVHLSF
jgi:hypothetical protein